MMQLRIAVLDVVTDPRKAEVLVFERDEVLPLFGCQPPRGENLSVQGLPPTILRELFARRRSLPSDDGLLADGAAEFDNCRAGNDGIFLFYFHG